MKNVGWAVFAAVVCGTAAAPVWAEGLAGLSAQLDGTGRIGTFTPKGTGIAPPDAGVPASGRDPASAVARINDAADARAARADDLGDAELTATETSVASCRVEVARRRKVPPGKVAAGTVVLRFTIERSGRVRDAEALSAPGTDLEVAACAKRVLSEWVFAKRAKDGAVVKRTYGFASPGS
jgi:Gram-negative bacterial TonB protein C-terminal